MGQLEAYGINEIYLSGAMVGLCGTYVAEEHESDSFESFKAYLYSVASFGIKLRKIVSIQLSPLLITTNQGAIYYSWSYLNLLRNRPLNTIKLVDDIES